MATIYCFTSTGNSLYTANAIADKIGGQVLPMRNVPTVCEDDVIGSVFPSYFWGLPRMVRRFAETLQITNKDAYVFAVVTGGGPLPSVLGVFNRCLKRGNIRLRYGERVVTVSNYLPMHEPKDSEVLRDKVKAQTDRIANAVANRTENRIPRPSFLNALAFSLMPKQDSDQYFDVSTSCTGCTTCQKVCPAGNITMEASRPVFRHNCEHCLACVHHCPTQAIDWKGKTQGKARYRNAHVTLDEMIAFNSRYHDEV